jgi:hypothetical protein
VFTVVVVGGGLFFVFRMLAGLTRGEKERQRLLQTGVPAHARVLQVSMGGMTVTTGVHRQLQLNLSIEVHRPGAPPYPAQITSLVSELQLPQVQPGAWLAVRVDPVNAQGIAIEALGVPPPGMAPQPGAGMGVPMGTPMTGFQIPMGAKIGMGVALVAAAIGIAAASMGTIRDLGGPSETCKKATACCRKTTGSSPACDNFMHVPGSVSEQVCGDAAKAYCK